MVVAVLLLLLSDKAPFIVDAGSEVHYTVEIARETLGEYGDDIGLFARNMPGVAGIEPLGNDIFLYHTKREVPLGHALETDFVIRRTIEGDSLTRYISTDMRAENWMSCKVLVKGIGAHQTSISISLRIRLSRENPSEIHWLAPVFGADFISEQMKEDLDSLLQEFVENSNKELYSRQAVPAPSIR